MADTQQIEVTNIFLVSYKPVMKQKHIKIGNLYRLARTISNEEALNLAAWLVALADEHNQFQQVLEAVKRT